jgi:thiosulfate/3-mercaptopyruvate sulfurtransferase
MSDYAHPEVLVTTEWVAAHSKGAGLRVVEVDVDTTAYDQGHVEGAISWNWQTELQDAIRRDLAQPTAFEELLGKAGISPETTIVLRRQQQLVRRLGILATEILRPRKSSHYERRPQEMA